MQQILLSLSHSITLYFLSLYSLTNFLSTNLSLIFFLSVVVPFLSLYPTLSPFLSSTLSYSLSHCIIPFLLFCSNLFTSLFPIFVSLFLASPSPSLFTAHWFVCKNNGFSFCFIYYKLYYHKDRLNNSGSLSPSLFTKQSILFERENSTNAVYKQRQAKIWRQRSNRK